MGEFDFMNNPNFGAPGGIAADQAFQMNNLAMQGAQAELNMLPDKQAHLRAQTARLNSQTEAVPSEIALRQAQASKAPAEILDLLAKSAENFATANSRQYGVAKLKALDEAMKRGAAKGGFATDVDGKPMSAAKTQAEWGLFLLQEGFPEAANEILKNSYLTQGAETSVKRLEHDKKKAEQDLDMEVYETVGRYTPWIKDQAGLDDLNKKIFERTKQHPPWFGNRYSPELIRGIEESSLKLKDKMNFQIREDKALADQRQRDITNSLRDLQHKLNEQRLDWSKEKFERDQKSGVVAPASTADADAVMQMAIQQNPKLKSLKGSDAAAFDQFTRSVADEAKKIYKQYNGALSMEQARYKALTSNIDQLKVGSSWGSTTVEYESKGIGARETPIPFTSDLKPVEGRYYSKGGKIGQWAKKPDGTFGMKLVE